MTQFNVQSTAVAMKVLKRILKPNITVSGTEHLSDQPTLYVINHFTRAETFLLPYVLYQQTGKIVHSLAHHSIFRGRFGEYLRSMGVVSTKEPNRDERIIGDLMTGRANWAIYPEGAMIKSKKIFKRGKYVLTTPDRVGPPRTGAATLSLRAELYRREYLRAIERHDTRTARELERRFSFRDPKEIGNALQIVPVSITWYPLRPGQNIIKRLAKFFFKVLPGRLEEELEIEGNLLLHRGDVSIHFNEPIPVADYAGKGFELAHRFIPFLRSLDKANPILRRRATKLTRRFMEEIYQNIEISFDHLFCTALKHLPLNGIRESDFKKLLFNAAVELWGRKRLRLHRTLRGDIFKLLRENAYEPYKSIRKLALEKDVINVKDDMLHVNRVRLEMMHLFHNVRIQNPIIVIANELEPVTPAIKIIANHCGTPTIDLNARTTDAVLSADTRQFARDHAHHFEEGASISTASGSPYLLRNPDSKIGIVLSHGYLASPGETADLAATLHLSGHNVYGVRLRDHGTHPRDLADAKWEEWLESYQRGVDALRQCCDTIIFGGFSTGGAVALAAAAARPNDCDAVFAVNAPWSLRSIRAHHAPAVHFWNEMLDSLKISTGKYEHVPNDPEFPETNYKTIYVSGLVQLDKLLTHTRKAVKRIKAPTLLIRGDEDPTVSPEGVQRIFDKLQVRDRRLITLNADRHVIIRGPGAEQVATQVTAFIDRIATPPPQQLLAIQNDPELTALPSTTG